MSELFNVVEQQKQQLPCDLFSRAYRLKNGQRAGIVYRTRNQAVATLDGDSAEVWQRVFEAGGDTASALDYILANGDFGENPRAEATAVLNDFLQDLEKSHILGSQRPQSEIAQSDSLRRTISPQENPEQVFAQIMSDERVLYSLALETTYRCNEKCVHCYLPEQNGAKDLSLEQIAALVTEFRSLGGFSLLLTGGELLTRPDITDIFALAKENGFLTSIYSNLTLLDERTLQAIAELCPRSVGCSIYSTRAELHDAITLLPGSLERSLTSIRRLREANVPVLLKTPLMKSTAPHWREMEALSLELGCGIQFDLSITAKNNGGLSPLTQRVTDSVLLDEIFSSQYYNLSYSGERLAAMRGPGEEAGLCGAGALSLTVGPGGDIRPCAGLNVTLGRYPADTLTKIWRESPFFQQWASLRAKDIGECAECADFGCCSRCPGAWHAEHGSWLRPTEYQCFLGHALARAQRKLTGEPSFSERKEVRV